MILTSTPTKPGTNICYSFLSSTYESFGATAKLLSNDVETWLLQGWGYTRTPFHSTLLMYNPFCDFYWWVRLILKWECFGQARICLVRQRDRWRIGRNWADRRNCCCLEVAEQLDSKKLRLGFWEPKIQGSGKLTFKADEKNNKIDSLRKLVKW